MPSAGPEWVGTAAGRPPAARLTLDSTFRPRHPCHLRERGLTACWPPEAAGVGVRLADGQQSRWTDSPNGGSPRRRCGATLRARGSRTQVSGRGVDFPLLGHGVPADGWLVESLAARPPCRRRPTQAVGGQNQCGRARGAKFRYPLSPLGQGARTSKLRLSLQHPLVVARTVSGADPGLKKPLVGPRQRPGAPPSASPSRPPGQVGSSAGQRPSPPEPGSRAPTDTRKPREGLSVREEPAELRGLRGP